jgi:hypothetical protein
MRYVRFAATLLVMSGGAAQAGSFDGVYNGASSIATGAQLYCTGTAPTRVTISGDSIVIDGQAYEGVDARGTGTVKPDGSFTAAKPTKDGKEVTYSGKVKGRDLIATWKGPVCTGTLSLSR